MRNQTFTVLAAAACLFAGVLAGQSVHAQNKAVGNLRLASDASGSSLAQEQAGPGEKVFHLDHGAPKMLIAYDFQGTSASEVQVRVMGVQGTIMMQETYKLDHPGTQVVTFERRGIPLDDGEYVVNVYVGPDFYLADSLQATVGAARLPEAGPTLPNEALPTMQLIAPGTPMPDANGTAISAGTEAAGGQPGTGPGTGTGAGGQTGGAAGYPAPGAAGQNPNNPAAVAGVNPAAGGQGDGAQGAGQPPAGDAAGSAAPGPSPAILGLAMAGMVALLGVVLWAGWSAMKR